jgi:8-oxo-dGTP pyrophosphatase MutT (NUDIX family)
VRTVTPKNAHPVPDSAERVFKGIIYEVYHYPQTMFDGSTRTFEMLKRPDTIEALAIKDGKIVAIIDEQPGRAPQFTLPGGRHDVESETELDCAKRELHEETGSLETCFCRANVRENRPSPLYFFGDRRSRRRQTTRRRWR